ncbi:MAG: DUF2799 domain-containing protein [Bdellovibrionota bacterium]
MKIQKIGLILWALFLVTGCASWEIKKRCEETNWYEYAQSVSFQGKYLEEDPFVKQCKEYDKINAQQVDLGFKAGREKGCTYTEIYNRGRTGVPVQFSFCDGLDMKLMQSRHIEGLKHFCTKANGYPFGKTGKVYQNVCSPAQEKDFLPTYHMGRHEYLKDRVTMLKEKENTLNSQIDAERIRESQVSREYANVPRSETCGHKTVFNAATSANETRLVCEESSWAVSQRNNLSSQLNSLRSRISELTGDRAKTQREIEATRDEMSKIPVGGGTKN